LIDLGRQMCVDTGADQVGPAEPPTIEPRGRQIVSPFSAVRPADAAVLRETAVLPQPGLVIYSPTVSPEI